MYYTLADLVLLVQCFYYRGFTLQDTIVKTHDHQDPPTERSSLLGRESSNGSPSHTTPDMLFPTESRRSPSPSLRERLSSLDGTRFSPAMPLHNQNRDAAALTGTSPVQKKSIVQSLLFNLAAILIVCAAGVLGWYLSDRDTMEDHDPALDRSDTDSTLEFNVLGQVFGYICAALYLGSRLPQLLLNYRRKSIEGVSMLFFIFACIGNLTYVLSILFCEPFCSRTDRGCRPGEAASMYATYFLVNLSWLLGSFGTLLLDLGVFVQYFMYKDESAGGQVQ